mmetsp:Transcript_10599/g.39496  ORF Transcript_10599/g.39496 Transcript_10599/m.39496 type:complete len:87 (+) Transcript_10599:738-998(+)
MRKSQMPPIEIVCSEINIIGNAVLKGRVEKPCSSTLRDTVEQSSCTMTQNSNPVISQLLLGVTMQLFPYIECKNHHHCQASKQKDC